MTEVEVLPVTVTLVGADGSSAGTMTGDVAGGPVPSMFFAEIRMR